MQLTLAGEPVQLLADRALYWPAARQLIVADVHLGKGAAFRRAGVPVPSGSSHDDLARLTALVAETAAASLRVLGDFFHTAPSAAEPAMAAFEAFRARHPALRLQAIRGNHDRGWQQLPAHWRIDWHGEALHEGPFVFRHEPTADARGYVLAGHIHPCVRLKTGAESLRLPVFWFGAAVGVLPGFGSFTGGWPVQPAGEDQVVAVTADGLVRLSPKMRVSAAQ